MKELNPIAEFARKIRENIETVFLGKTAVVDMLITAFLARGHVLLEDVPGTGKTILARAFASSLNLSFARIQCTPDLLPADILGVSVWRQPEEFDDKKERFVYRAGPLVNQFVLVDEINRATPRTQSALLEAQKDRFLLSLNIGYPDLESEAHILENQRQLTHPVAGGYIAAGESRAVSFGAGVRGYTEPGLCYAGGC
jgi:MoxR-like ATPase